MRILLIGIIIFKSISVVGQELDSIIIYKNELSIIDNPFMDSIKLKNKETRGIFINFQECPEYFFFNADRRDTLLLSDKINTFKSSEVEYTAYCQITTDWQAIIREIRVVKYKGQIDKVEIANFFDGLLATELTRFGFPIGSKCIIIVYKPK